MSTDHYAAGKGSVRDNVKLLITVFGGVAGVLLAGTPFSGLGDVDTSSSRFLWAISSLGVAATSLFACLWNLLRVLQPGTADSSVLRDDFDSSKLPRSIRKEIREVVAEFGREKAALLPPPLTSIAELDLRSRQQWNRYLGSTNKALKEDAHKAFLELYEAKATLNQWAAFTWMKFRYARAVRNALLLGLVALGALACFAVAVGGEKKAVSQSIIVLGDLTRAEIKLPALPAVLFEHGSAKLSKDSLVIIARTGSILRANDQIGVVLYAYTDTTAGAAINKKLALQRAEVVRDLLMGEGGIGAARIFLAPLPKRDLPTVTGPEVSQTENRAVRLVLIPLPQGR
jgi:outer membrane protein OmpA-like peptidoglycan-associated protein